MFDDDNDHHPAYADGTLTVSAGHDAGEFATAWAERYKLSPALALVAIGEIEEYLIQKGMSADRIASLQAFEFLKKVIMTNMQFHGKPAMIRDITAFALRMEHLIPPLSNGKPIQSQQDLADRWRCKKANIAKTLKWLQERCGIPPRPDQRTEDARAAMAASRKNQLKPQ